jgi:hypothetical protein
MLVVVTLVVAVTVTVRVAVAVLVLVLVLVGVPMPVVMPTRLSRRMVVSAGTSGPSPGLVIYQRLDTLRKIRHRLGRKNINVW